MMTSPEARAGCPLSHGCSPATRGLRLLLDDDDDVDDNDYYNNKYYDDDDCNYNDDGNDEH